MRLWSAPVLWAADLTPRTWVAAAAAESQSGGAAAALVRCRWTRSEKPRHQRRKTRARLVGGQQSLRQVRFVFLVLDECHGGRWSYVSYVFNKTNHVGFGGSSDGQQHISQEASSSEMKRHLPESDCSYQSATGKTLQAISNSSFLQYCLIATINQIQLNPWSEKKESDEEKKDCDSDSETHSHLASFSAVHGENLCSLAVTEPLARLCTAQFPRVGKFGCIRHMRGIGTDNLLHYLKYFLTQCQNTGTSYWKCCAKRRLTIPSAVCCYTWGDAALNGGASGSQPSYRNGSISCISCYISGEKYAIQWINDCASCYPFCLWLLCMVLLCTGLVQTRC